MADDRISKAELKMLERMFEAEIESALSKSKMPYCFQSKSKIMGKLQAKGLVESIEFTIGSGPLAVSVEGYVLTASGHLTYRMSC